MVPVDDGVALHALIGEVTVLLGLVHSLAHGLNPWPEWVGGGDVLTKAKVAISMDGRGSWRDNVFVERLWRTIKYEEVYLRAYDTVSQARASIGRYLAFYNGQRPHSALDRQTPDQAYFTRLPHSAAA